MPSEPRCDGGGTLFIRVPCPDDPTATMPPKCMVVHHGERPCQGCSNCQPGSEEVIRWRRVEDGLPEVGARCVVIYHGLVPVRATYLPPGVFEDDFGMVRGVTWWAPWPRGPEGGRT